MIAEYQKSVLNSDIAAMVFQHFKATTMDPGTLKVKCIIGLDAFTYPNE